MTDIRVIPLGKTKCHLMMCKGAGQDVGRSCILVSLGGKNIMLDCGMHMGYNDEVCATYCLSVPLSVASLIFLLLYKNMT